MCLGTVEGAAGEAGREAAPGRDTGAGSMGVCCAKPDMWVAELGDTSSWGPKCVSKAVSLGQCIFQVRILPRTPLRSPLPFRGPACRRSMQREAPLKSGQALPLRGLAEKHGINPRKT